MENPVEDCADIYRMDFTYPFLSGINPLRLPASIVIPQKSFDAMAGMERQYWEIKMKYFDVLIFFKKGKFYELYDHDATIAHREFGLKMVFDSTNRGKMRLAGVPEQSFSEWARLFVFRGYKVGRVEQMKEEESITPGKGTASKVLHRELVEVLTPGTLTDPLMISGYNEVFILALYPLPSHCLDAVAVDLSRRVAYRCPCGVGGGAVRCEEILLMVSALLQQLHPREIIIPRNLLDTLEDTNKNTSFVKSLVEWIEGDGFRVELVDTSGISDFLDDAAGMPSPSAASHFLVHYFRTLKLCHAESILSEAQLYTSHLPHHQKQQYQLGVASSNACGHASSDTSTILRHERREDRGLVLDATTVSNLEVVANLRDGTEKGSLNQLLNRCCTNGGRRLFRSWILRPSSSHRVITARQAAIRFIIEHGLDKFWGKSEEIESSVRSAADEVGSGSSPCAVKRGRQESTFEVRFSGLIGVDFERNLSRLAELKNNNTQVAFVDPLVQYKKHLQLILSTVEALKEMIEWSRSVQNSASPPLLRELWSEIDAAAPAVASIEGCFDFSAAQTLGIIIPSRGTSPSYDAASDRLDGIEVQLQNELRRMQETLFGGAVLSFSDIGRDRFLVEVPIRAAPKMSPAGFVERSRTATNVRYIVSAIEPLVEEHKRATTDKSDALLVVLRNVATHICNFFPLLYGATAAISYFDCLLGLASLRNCALTTAWPVVEENSTGSCVVAEQLTHPFLNRESVPNTVCLDTVHGRILVLTGPNMAGKSTLMRTVAVNVIIAQMGGPIFGASMRFVPTTRIFTRIGARDASHKGQSTLYIELSETAEILRHADQWSMCLVDELGRGTSTHDGYAIAYAMLSSLKKRQPASPLVLFSTHYHALAQEQMGEGAADKVFLETTSHRATLVQLGYMDFALSDATKGGIPEITFLYRLVPGVCTRSYGVEVALLAGVPPSLVNTASVKSLELVNWYSQRKDLNTIRHFITHARTEGPVKAEEL